MSEASTASLHSWRQRRKAILQPVSSSSLSAHAPFRTTTGNCQASMPPSVTAASFHYGYERRGSNFAVERTSASSSASVLSRVARLPEAAHLETLGLMLRQEINGALQLGEMDVAELD